MSGPKRADVQAALNIAARSAQASAAVISRADRDAVGHMSRRLSDALKDATSLGSSLEQAAEALAHVEHQGSDTESARKAVEAALAALGSGLGEPSRSLATAGMLTLPRISHGRRTTRHRPSTTRPSKDYVRLAATTSTTKWRGPRTPA